MPGANDDDIEAISHWLLTDAESSENVRQQGIRSTLSGYFLQGVARVLQIGQHEFFGKRATALKRRVPRAFQSVARSLEQRRVPQVGDRRTLGLHIHAKLVEDSSPQCVETVAGDRRYFDGAVVPPHSSDVALIQSDNCLFINYLSDEIQFASLRRYRGIRDDDNQIGDFDRLQRTADALSLDDVVGVMDTCRIHECHSKTIQIESLGDEIAGRSGNLRDNRAST